MATKKTYKDLQAELDVVVEKLQAVDIDVDDALKLYKRGQELIAQLEGYLGAAKNEIEHLKKS